MERCKHGKGWAAACPECERVSAAEDRAYEGRCDGQQAHRDDYEYYEDA